MALGCLIGLRFLSSSYTRGVPVGQVGRVVVAAVGGMQTGESETGQGACPNEDSYGKAQTGTHRWGC